MTDDDAPKPLAPPSPKVPLYHLGPPPYTGASELRPRFLDPEPTERPVPSESIETREDDNLTARLRGLLWPW